MCRTTEADATPRRRGIVTLQRHVGRFDWVIDTSLLEDDAEGPLHHAVAELEATRARVTRA